MPEPRSLIPDECQCNLEKGNALSKLEKMMPADEKISRNARNQDHADHEIGEIREPKVLISAHMRTLSSFLGGLK
jgi:hypothetical protein